MPSVGSNSADGGASARDSSLPGTIHTPCGKAVELIDDYQPRWFSVIRPLRFDGEPPWTLPIDMSA